MRYLQTVTSTDLGQRWGDLLLLLSLLGFSTHLGCCRRHKTSSFPQKQQFGYPWTCRFPGELSNLCNVVSTACYALVILFNIRHSSLLCGDARITHRFIFKNVHKIARECVVVVVENGERLWKSKEKGVTNPYQQQQQHGECISYHGCPLV